MSRFMLAGAVLFSLAGCGGQTRADAPPPPRVSDELREAGVQTSAINPPPARIDTERLEPATPVSVPGMTSPPLARPASSVTVLQATGSTDEVAPVPSAATAAPARTDELGTRVTAEQVMRLPPDYYAVQLVAFREKSDVEAFIRQHALGDPAFGRIKRNGELWYVLLYGVWPTHAEAEAAAGNRPASLKAITPWVRRLGDLQEAIRAVAE